MCVPGPLAIPQLFVVATLRYCNRLHAVVCNTTYTSEPCVSLSNLQMRTIRVDSRRASSSKLLSSRCTAKGVKR
ncbi:hypothetical protein C2E23DRAFT_876591 [Lenzites betulinus]|nr:hypothetical protein C2E23DRAFT_876591 [Lenzites betulinus]